MSTVLPHEYAVQEQYRRQLQALRESRESVFVLEPDTKTPEIEERVESILAEIDRTQNTRDGERADCVLKEARYEEELLTADSETLLTLDDAVRLHRRKISAFEEKIKGLQASRDSLLAERKTILENRARIVEDNRIITLCNGSKDESVKLADTMKACAVHLREIAQTVIHERNARPSADNFKRLDDTQRVVKEVLVELLETIRRASHLYGSSPRSEREVASTFLEKQ